MLHCAETPGRYIEQMPDRRGAKSQMGRIHIQMLAKILKRTSNVLGAGPRIRELPIGRLIDGAGDGTQEPEQLDCLQEWSQKGPGFLGETVECQTVTAQCEVPALDYGHRAHSAGGGGLSKEELLEIVHGLIDPDKRTFKQGGQRL